MYFCDDEQRNLVTVDSYARTNGLPDRLIAVAVNTEDQDMLWRDLLTKVRDGSRQDSSAKQVIHFFDIDGTLLKLPAQIHVVERRTGKQLLSISQEQFAEHPEADYWFKRVGRESPDIPRENLQLDFGAFENADTISAMVAAGARKNKMLKTS